MGIVRNKWALSLKCEEGLEHLHGVLFILDTERLMIMPTKEKQSNVWAWIIVILIIFVGIYFVRQQHQSKQSGEWLDKTTKAHSTCYEDVRKGTQTMNTCNEIGTDGHELLTDRYYQEYMTQHRSIETGQ